MCLKQQCTAWIWTRMHSGEKDWGRERGRGGERDRRAEKRMRRERMTTTSDRWKRRVDEQCTKKPGVVTLDCINKNSSPHLKTTGLFKDHLKCWWWCVWYYTSRQLTSFSPTTSPTNSTYPTCYNDTSSSPHSFEYAQTPRLSPCLRIQGIITYICVCVYIYISDLLPLPRIWPLPLQIQ